MSEPILWADAAKSQRRIPARRYNAAIGAMEDIFDDDTGERLYEKIPQRGHVGGDYERPVLGKATWMHVLRHDGHVVRHKLTCAAADYDMSQLTSQERKAKARHFGWIPVGHCPIALVVSGEVKSGQLIAKDLRGITTPCVHGTYGETKPCTHYLAEEAARKALQAKKQAASDKRMQPEAEKLIAAQQTQTKEIVAGIGDALAKVINRDNGNRTKP
jgi:hypothetical protein